jgi:hypothetical protein
MHSYVKLCRNLGATMQKEHSLREIRGCRFAQKALRLPKIKESFCFSHARPPGQVKESTSEDRRKEDRTEKDGIPNKLPRATAPTGTAAPQLRPQIRHPGPSRSRVGEQGTLHPQLCRKGPACRRDGNHQWTQRRWPGFEPARECCEQGEELSGNADKIWNV